PRRAGQHVPDGGNRCRRRFARSDRCARGAPRPTAFAGCSRRSGATTHWLRAVTTLPRAPRESRHGGDMSNDNRKSPFSDTTEGDEEDWEKALNAWEIPDAAAPEAKPAPGAAQPKAAPPAPPKTPLYHPP